MRTVTALLALMVVGLVRAEDEVQKPEPRDMRGQMAAPYTGKKVEVTGRITGYSVDPKEKKWFFPIELQTKDGKPTTVTIYLFFDDMDAAKELKDKIKEKPVATVRGTCEFYRDLAPNARVIPVILNGTEIIEYKAKEKPKEPAKDKPKGPETGTDKPKEPAKDAPKKP